jgi:alkaline phosphatase D
MVLFSRGLYAQHYPDNIYADSAYAPFLYGVASGDPLQDRIMIWTKVEPRTQPDETSITLRWQITDDSSFQKIIQQGDVTASASADFTAKADAGGLKPGHHYYYRFITPEGKISRIGKAQTLPDDSVKHFKLAVVSCSSIWAGYFNAYSRIAEREDIDFLLHLGDYVYDYPDERQLNRMPAEYPKDCASLKDWRERHTYYLLDPDLRAARQNKTWFALWDNHDTDVEAPGKTEEAIQAFYEYLPIRMPDTNYPENIYRRFQFGALADLNLMDMHLFRGKEEYEPGKKSVLGLAQDAWIKNNLKTSTTQWHLLGNQEMMTDWLSEGAPKFVRNKRGDGRVFDPSNWNGFPEDRQRLYDFIEANNINNVVVLTGDIHMSFVMNVTGYPKDKTKYNKRTGEGAIGVEVAGPSISRVNMQESGVPRIFIPLVQSVSRSLNPHHVWCKFTEHGYFTLDVTPERCLAEFWYVPINKRTDKQQFGRGYTVKSGDSHWMKKPNRKRSRSTYP